jgi:hypothetical protein
MLKIHSSMLCTSIFTWELLENLTYHGNLMIIRVTSVEWTWLGYLKSKGDYALG